MSETVTPLALRNLLSGLTRVPVRFPMPLTCGIGWAAVTIAREHGIGALEWTDVERLQVMFLSGLFVTLAATLFAEGRGWIWLLRQGTAAAALALTAFVAYTADGRDPYNSPAFYLLAPGGALLMTVAPFLRRGADGQAVWHFNLCSWVSALFGLIVAAGLGLGITAFLAGLETLFKVDVSNAYGDAWIVCMSVVWPWQTLAGVPGGFGPLSDDQAPRWSEYLVSWLLVPLALVYLAMLVAFALMIVVTWNLPRGTIGWMVGVFAAYGVAVWSAAHPYRDSGNALVRLYYRYFHFALFVPVLLLAVGVGMRVLEYGVTEKRYALVLLTVWLSGIGLYGVLRRPAHLVVAPATLGAMLIIGAVGPWGASSISLRSQLGQLGELLKETGILRDGKLSVPAETVGSDLAIRISSVVDYLNTPQRQPSLFTQLGDRGIDLPIGSSSADIVAALGMEYVDSWGRRRPRHWGWTRSDPDVMAVGGFEVAVRLALNSGGQQGRFVDIAGTRSAIRFTNIGDALRISMDGPGDVAIDLVKLVETLQRDGLPGYNNAVNFPLMTVDARDNGLKTRVYFTTITGEGPSDALRIRNLSFIALIGTDKN